jgi:hypothetical protein
MTNMPATINVPAQIPEGSSGFATRDAVLTPDTIYVQHMMLYAGVNYQFVAVGHTEEPATTMIDPAIGVYSTDFKTLFLQADNNAAGGLDPNLIFHVSVTGNYGIAVASALPNGTGTFDMNIRPYGQNPITPENAPAFHGSAGVQFSPFGFIPDFYNSV